MKKNADSAPQNYDPNPIASHFKIFFNFSLFIILSIFLFWVWVNRTSIIKVDPTYASGLTTNTNFDFNSVNFSVSADNKVNLVQDISPNSSVTFSGLKLTSIGASPASLSTNLLSLNPDGVLSGVSVSEMADLFKSNIGTGPVGPAGPIGATGPAGTSGISALPQDLSPNSKPSFAALNISGLTSFAGISYAWPNSAGTSGQFLTTDGSGNLNWQSLSCVNSGFVCQNSTGSTNIMDMGNNALAITSHGVKQFVMDTNGNIGIGFQQPGTGLAVGGVANTDGDLGFQVNIANNVVPFSGSPVAGIHFDTYYNSANNLAGLGGIQVGKQNSIDGDLASYMSFHTRNSASAITERLRIDNNGNIGIGTTSPNSLLQIGSTTNAGDLVVYGTGTTCTIGNSTGATTCSSDLRLKTNISPLSHSLEKILKLNPVNFQWKDPARSGKTNIGLIAQEVESIFPESVAKVGEYKGIDYAILVVPLIQAIHELNDKILAIQSSVKLNSNIQVASSSAALNHPDQNTGHAKISKDSKNVIIADPNVRADSRIFVTPTTLTSQVLTVIQKVHTDSESSFEVAITEPAKEDIEFDYWLINQ